MGPQYVIPNVLGTLKMNSSNGFREGTEPRREVNFHFKAGGLGDQICRLPAVKWAIENNPNLVVNLWVPDYFHELATNAIHTSMFLDDAYRIKIRKESEFTKSHECAAFPTELTDETFHTSLKTHLVDLACRTLLDRDLEMKDKNYLKVCWEDTLKDHNLPYKGYAVICTGFTAPTRELLPETINAISNFVLTKGLIPVFLGAKKPNNDTITGFFSSDVNYEKGVSLIDKTDSLIEAAVILGRARLVIGVDNGLLHLAAMASDYLPIVAGYTSVLPETRLPIRADLLGHNVFVVTPDETLECRGCQSRMNHVYRHDFRECFYKDYSCLSQLTVTKWKEQINKALGVPLP